MLLDAMSYPVALADHWGVSFAERGPFTVIVVVLFWIPGFNDKNAEPVAAPDAADGAGEP